MTRQNNLSDGAFRVLLWLLASLGFVSGLVSGWLIWGAS